ncbi:MAG: HEPN domain-containing protein, partial [Asticcacaulis sp.]
AHASHAGNPPRRPRSVTPEARFFLGKARRLLTEAEAMLAIHLYEAAGRTAYLAGFHAAQALISERTGKSAKTHKGVHGELHRLLKDRSDVDETTRIFLSQAYNLKAIADYETGPEAEVPPDQARIAVDGAKRFVAKLEKLVDTTG